MGSAPGIRAIYDAGSIGLAADQLARAAEAAKVIAFEVSEAHRKPAQALGAGHREDDPRDGEDQRAWHQRSARRSLLAGLLRRPALVPSRGPTSQDLGMGRPSTAFSAMALTCLRASRSSATGSASFASNTRLASGK